MNERRPADDAANILIGRCRTGDKGAFASLMTMHQHYARLLAQRVLGDGDHADDVVQEAFVRVWKNLRTYQTTGKFTTWLYKIVVNLCYDRMKAESRRTRIIGLFNREEETISVREEDYETKDTAEILLKLSRNLPPKQQLVFTLRDVQDFTMEEISEMIEMSVSSVKTNLFYARRSIRKAYELLERRGNS